MDADAAVGERLDGIVGEGRAQEVPAEAFELRAVATVDGRGGVQVHAEVTLDPRQTPPIHGPLASWPNSVFCEG